MIHKYINKDGKEEVVDPERWVWGVIYNDETEFHQFGGDGSFHKFDEIDWSKAQIFTMYRYDDMSKNFSIVIEPGMKIFHFYRNVKPHYLDHFVRAYVFGFEQKIKGHKAKFFNIIMPDDRVIQSASDNVDLVSFNIGQ